MDEPCRCGGRNPYCDFCQGSGFVSPPTTFTSRPYQKGAPGSPTKAATRFRWSLFIDGEPAPLVVEDDGGPHLLCIACGKRVFRDRLRIHARQFHVSRRKRIQVRVKRVKASPKSRRSAAAHAPSRGVDRKRTIAKRRKRKAAKGKSRKRRTGAPSLQRVSQGGHDRGWRGRR